MQLISTIWPKHFVVLKITIHRDLDDLEKVGVLRKVRGSATIDAGTQVKSDFRLWERQDLAEMDAWLRQHQS